MTCLALSTTDLPRRAGPIGWIAAYAQVFGSNYHVEPDVLAAEAWQRFAEGGSAIALRLLDRAVSAARTPVEKAVLWAQQGGMAIALQRFADAASQPGPPSSVPAPLRSFLLQVKGWGQVMSGEAEKAMVCLAAARDACAVDESRRDELYLMNITALCELRRGRPDAALCLENQIAEPLGGSGPARPPLGICELGEPRKVTPPRR